MSDIPEDIIKSLLAVGKVEWGRTFTQSDEKHVEDFRNTLRLTREYFRIEKEETAIHGVYLEGTGTVLAHTGMSPNSSQHARILVGAWNQLVDLARGLSSSQAMDDLIEASSEELDIPSSQANREGEEQ